MSLKGTYLYDIQQSPDFEDALFVTIVDEAFWKRHGYVDDQTPDELYDVMEAAGFAEAMESVFEFMGDRQNAETILKGMGMRPDDEFTDFLSNTG